MRVAVISDIHADLGALERVLSRIGEAGVEEIWCLGDLVGLGGQRPAEVLDAVRRACSLVLGGNHDAWVSGALTLDSLALPRQRTELIWQREQLSGEQLAWLAARSSHAQQGDVELWHGSAEDPLTGWVDSEAGALKHLGRQRTDIGLVGHTHLSAAGRLDRGKISWGSAPFGRVDLSGGRWVLNPGAVRGSCSWLELDLAARVAVWRGG